MIKGGQFSTSAKPYCSFQHSIILSLLLLGCSIFNSNNSKNKKGGQLILSFWGPKILQDSTNCLGLVEHYYFQLKFYLPMPADLRAASKKGAEGFNNHLVCNRLRCFAISNPTPNHFFKLNSALVSKGKGAPPSFRIVVRFWLREFDRERQLKKKQETTKQKQTALNLKEEGRLFFILKGAPDVLFWCPSGLKLLMGLKDYIRSELLKRNYDEILTPQLLPRSLWQRSGHKKHYGSNMFSTGRGDRSYVFKPMNCVGHICSFRRGRRSSSDLPLRLAEFGVCHRKESSGSISGPLRTVGFTQDDAHIFCSRDQIRLEVGVLHRSMLNVYTAFGFGRLLIKLSYPSHLKFCWGLLVLRTILKEEGAKFEEVSGEGAFYGAKVEYHLDDGRGHYWQCGTFQLDETLPQTMGLYYTEEDGRRARPIILHRAMLGSLERFIGILTAHHNNSLPAWLAPTKVMVLSVAEVTNYLKLICQVLKNKNIPFGLDGSNQNINCKINRHHPKKIPLTILLGAQEQKLVALSIRIQRKPNKFKKVLTLESFVYLLNIQTRLLVF
ncbi:threonyl-tRNA synthetase [Candidatus Tremblaya phenacola PAVE]|nr:threonyl-tRNA synthetase [Candidatus Tremblaya phenacola PAVE]